MESYWGAGKENAYMAGVLARLKKDLEEVKSSETYRLARLIGLPVRIFRRIFRKGIWRKYQ